MATEGYNRWWYDGYRARHNGKLRSTNPIARNDPRKVFLRSKYKRWDEGWEFADTQIRGMTEWDQEQDMINHLIEEISNG